MSVVCTHLDEIRTLPRWTLEGGEGCRQTGDGRVHLRCCLICSHVGCDASKNMHATKHVHATDHLIIRSFKPGAARSWCSLDEAAWASAAWL